MSKFDKRANELLDRVHTIMRAFETSKDKSGLPDRCTVESNDTKQYPDILTDLQTLLFCESPKHPLYVQAMKLNERRDTVLSRYGDRFSYRDFVNLESILIKYLEYRTFLEAED